MRCLPGPSDLLITLIAMGSSAVLPASDPAAVVVLHLVTSLKRAPSLHTWGPRRLPRAGKARGVAQACEARPCPEGPGPGRCSPWTFTHGEDRTSGPLSCVRFHEPQAAQSPLRKDAWEVWTPTRSRLPTFTSGTDLNPVFTVPRLSAPVPGRRGDIRVQHAI